MKQRSCAVLVLVLISFASPAAASDNEEPLVLLEEQAGIAGKQVWMWEIQPGGTWKMARFRLDGEGVEVADSREEKSGKLTEAGRMELLAVAKSNNLVGLPARFGKDAKINAHRYILITGKAQSILEGVPPRRGRSVKANILQAAPKGDLQAAHPWTRFADIAQAVCEGCGRE